MRAPTFKTNQRVDSHQANRMLKQQCYPLQRDPKYGTWLKYAYEIIGSVFGNHTEIVFGKCLTKTRSPGHWSAKDGVAVRTNFWYVLDGQHRLLALIDAFTLAKKVFSLIFTYKYVTFDTDEEMFDYYQNQLDNGTPRKAEDFTDAVTSFANIPRIGRKHASAASRFIDSGFNAPSVEYRVDQGGKFKRGGVMPTNSQKTAVIVQNAPEISEYYTLYEQAVKACTLGGKACKPLKGFFLHQGAGGWGAGLLARYPNRTPMGNLARQFLIELFSGAVGGGSQPLPATACCTVLRKRIIGGAVADAALKAQPGVKNSRAITLYYSRLLDLVWKAYKKNPVKMTNLPSVTVTASITF